MFKVPAVINLNILGFFHYVQSPKVSKTKTRDTSVLAGILRAAGKLRVKIEMNFTLRNDPHTLFEEWLAEASKTEPNDPTAMALATVDESGMPNVRMVLLKGHDERGFVFYTNFEGTKGQEILASKKAALGFHWKSLRRQVRVRGTIEIVTDDEADAYFNSRHPQSRLGAWASEQSRPLKDRETLVNRLHEFEEKYGNEGIPRPPHWSGFRIVPESIEFWKDGEFRLHDRVVFEPNGANWTSKRLNP